MNESVSEKVWVIPYVDQPPCFWKELQSDLGRHIHSVYFPLPGGIVGSGRPPQPDAHFAAFLRHAHLPCSVLVNPIVLPQPAEQLASAIVEAVRRLDGECHLKGITISNLEIAGCLRETLPHLSLTASVLMDIAHPQQVVALDGVCDALVPSTRIMRDRKALEELRAAFPGNIRLLVNEACLPSCPYRVQHFYEMSSGISHPMSLCTTLLERHPWLALTGAWVLPQHLHLYDGIHTQLKLAGRITLSDPTCYRSVLQAYVQREPLLPNQIGGGPASVKQPINITEDFYKKTMECNRACSQCSICRDYWNAATASATGSCS